MAPEITQQQNKPSRKGFFVLIAIIAVVVFAAYALTRKQSGNVPVEMTESEREALASQFNDVPQKEMTKQDRDALVKVYGSTKATTLSEAERKQLAEQFNN
ncbi:MAG: hypothetical protein KBB70_00875 [Candidatus Pacebacteria bacterium]|nr:hypothetical protein [Candidatus Paceibacterota bacterium]